MFFGIEQNKSLESKKNVTKLKGFRVIKTSSSSSSSYVRPTDCVLLVSLSNACPAISSSFSSGLGLYGFPSRAVTASLLLCILEISLFPFLMLEELK